MVANNPKSRAQALADIEELEARLQAALQPVTPRDSFCHDLRQQVLIGFANQGGRRQTSVQYLLFILASLLGGVTLLIFGARGIKSLMQSVGRMQAGRATVTINPAV